MGDVIPFPSQLNEGLTDREIRAVIAECARISSELLKVTPISRGTDEGARAVTILDDRGEAKWTVCREHGSLLVLDCDPDADDGIDGYDAVIRRGASWVVDSLREALTRDG